MAPHTTLCRTIYNAALTGEHVFGALPYSHPATDAHAGKIDWRTLHSMKPLDLALKQTYLCIC